MEDSEERVVLHGGISLERKTRKICEHVKRNSGRLPEEEIEPPHWQSGSEQGGLTLNDSPSKHFTRFPHGIVPRMQEGLRSRISGTVNGDSLNKSHGAISTGVDTIERTDYSRWRLEVEHGRQTWTYIDPSKVSTWTQSIPEKYHLGLETVHPHYLLGLSVGTAEIACTKDNPAGGAEWNEFLCCFAD